MLAVFVFGSRSREGFADEASDYDVGVVVREGDLNAFDRRWPYERGSSIEIASTTVSGLREHAEPGTASEWARYQYAHVRIILDKTGEITPILEEKGHLPEPHRRAIAASAVDAYVNSTHRSLRNRTVGLKRAAVFDAAESVPPFLTSIFAFEGRVRPFNKWLEWELREHPLEESRWTADLLLPRLDRVGAGDPPKQHGLFRDLEEVARSYGFGDEIDEWEPDLAWLRGDGQYRPERTVSG